MLILIKIDPKCFVQVTVKWSDRRGLLIRQFHFSECLSNDGGKGWGRKKNPRVLGEGGWWRRQGDERFVRKAGPGEKEFIYRVQERNIQSRSLQQDVKNYDLGRFY